MISSLCFIDITDKFREYLSSKHPNIKFSIEKEEDGRLPFLTFFMKMINLQLMSIEKIPSVGFIPTSKVLYLKHKIGLIKSLSFPCFTLCSDFIKFHHEIDKSKNILYKNSYPCDLVDKCIKEFLDKYWHLNL